MTFNISVLTPEFAICAADRRLTTPRGRIVTERSNKLTLIDFDDGHGFITYTGVGWDFRKRTPTDWIRDIDELGSLTVDQSVAAIKADAEPRLQEISRRGFDTRHTFVIGGFKFGVPFFIMLSNYDSVDGPERPSADPVLSVSGHQMSLDGVSQHSYLIIATGAHPRHPSRIPVRLVPPIKRGATAKLLRKLIVKTVKDIAYQDDRKAAVGSSVQSVIVSRDGERDMMMSVPGGTTLSEGPNLIGRGMKFADFYVDTSPDTASRFNAATGKARIAETPCQNCGAPVPEGYRICGACDEPLEPAGRRK